MKYRRFTTAAISCVTIAMVSLGITGCTQDKEPVIVENKKITEKFPALTDKQIDSLFTSTVKVLEEGDKAKDSSKLAARVTEPALSMRGAQYTLATTDETFVIPPFPAQRGTVTLTASQDWPRYVVNIAAVDEKSPTYVELFQQSGARDHFKLSHWARLFPKQTVPPTAVTKKGAEIIAPDAQGYKMKAQDAVAKYAENIFDSDKLGEAGFEVDPLAKVLQADSKTYQDELSSHYEFSHSLKPEGTIVSIALEDGGILTFAVYGETMSAQRVNDDARMQLKGEIGALLGDDGKADNGFEATAKVVTAMVIPQKDSDKKIHVIGAERLFTSAKAL